MGYNAQLMLIRKPIEMGIFGCSVNHVVLNKDIDHDKYGVIPYYGYEEEYYSNIKDYSIVRPVYDDKSDRVLTCFIYEYELLKFYQSTAAYSIVDVLNTIYKDFKSGVYCNIPIEIAKKVFGSLIPDTFNENIDAIFFYSD